MCHIARGQEVLQSLLHVTALCEGPPETRNNAPEAAQKPRASRLLCHSPRNWFQRKPDRNQWNLQYLNMCIYVCVYIYVDSVCT